MTEPDAASKNRMLWGDNHKSVKIVCADVPKIREMWVAGQYTQKELGEMFGVNRRHIGKIVNYQRCLKL